MASRIYIRHIRGARSHQTDEFSIDGLRGITAGRDESANIRFDPQQDDLVSREHLRITPELPGAQTFRLSDMNSRNGTYLNRQRVTQPVVLHHNDVVQLGLEGPEFRFELDPPPASAAKPTRVMNDFESSALSRSMPTREMSVAGSAPRPIGRATVERMLGDTFGKVKHESNKTFWIGIAAIVLIGVVGASTFLMFRRSSETMDTQAAQQQKMLLQISQAANRVSPGDPAVKAQIAQISSELKKMMVQNGPTRPAAAQKGQAASGTPAQDSASSDAASSYNDGFARASQEYKSGDAASAYRDCAALISTDQTRWEAYYLAGLSLNALQQPDQAVRLYQYAMQYAPDSARASINQKLNEAQAAAQAAGPMASQPQGQQ